MKINSKKQHARLFPYAGACLVLPVILMIKGYAIYSLVASIVAMLLFNFDPAFKFYKSNIPYFTRYMKISFLSGMLLAALAFVYPILSGWVIAIWGLPTFIYGFKLSGKVDDLEDK